MSKDTRYLKQTHTYVFVLMSYLGKLLSQELQIPFIEGDELHPEANINKMSLGIPLKDSDRYPWLQDIINNVSKLADTKNSQYILVSCSALKAAYREFLRKNFIERNIITWFVYLKNDKQILKERMQRRGNHFMKVNMLESQFKDLEEPINEVNTVTVEADNNLSLVKKIIHENTNKYLPQFPQHTNSHN
ncbi:9926_t:CDS:2 [Scutellospora calospora]|uniref:9926_t:CDS:1 n=1 Tax=Scutellospora calospora TaxID=85575 RepID=A0ACA9K0E8_9GLOM|nr:9926_t:CDS:2 [Scutellospora calospora]